MKALFNRKSEREAATKRLAKLVKPYGFTVTLDDDRGLPRSLNVSIETVHGLTASIDLWPADAVLIHWHGLRSPHKLAKGFSDDVNSFHFHKATACADSLEELCLKLDRDLDDIQSGDAFQ